MRDLALGERTGLETLDALAAEFTLTPEELAQRLPSGKPATFFITSSTFTKEAEAYAESIQTTIALVSGAQLAELMIDHGVGVTAVRRYETKRVDSDYFAVE